jgi:hypothetical protein
MVMRNLLYIVTFVVLIFNIIIRVFPKKFIDIPIQGYYKEVVPNIIPTSLYTYCDVYLLLLFIILIFFFLGVDFNNSMEEIALAVGGSKTNKFMLRKLAAILLLYSVLYLISFVNIYTLYVQLLKGNNGLIPIIEIIIYSLTTNIFIISLSLFILLISRDIAVSTSIITSYYLIEEALWKCKITDKKGILEHIYEYYEFQNGELIKIKLIYMLLSIAILFITYKISKRKFSFGIKKLWKHAQSK